MQPIRSMWVSVLPLSFFILGAGGALAADIQAVEPNNTIADAQSIDNDFTVGANPDILNADTWPWVSISASGDGTFDYYSFSVPAAGVTGVFDIDYGSGSGGSLDTQLCLYDEDGTFLEGNDDWTTTAGAGGSVSSEDSYIEVEFSAAGTFVIAVGEFPSSCQQGGMAGNSPDEGDTYELQVSLSEHVLDSDGDGVPDDEDCNPYSDLSPTVAIGDCDSGVDNTLFEDGCTISDLVFACADDTINHGSFSSCVADVTKSLVRAGDIAGSEKGAIQSCAARSDFGK